MLAETFIHITDAAGNSSFAVPVASILAVSGSVITAGFILWANTQAAQAKAMVSKALDRIDDTEDREEEHRTLTRKLDADLLQAKLDRPLAATQNVRY